MHFLATPYILHKLGADAYGILAIVFVVLGYFGFLELGLGKAVVKYVSEFYVKKEFETIGKIIGSALIFYCIIGIAGMVVIWCITGLLVSNALRIPSDLRDIASFVFYISALGFLINMLCNVFGSIPNALQRFDISNKVDLLVATMQTVLSVLLLYFGFFLRELVMLNVVLSILSMSIYMIISRKLLPEVKIKITFSPIMLKRMFKFGGFVAVDNILTAISTRINQLIMGIYLPISLLTYYVIPNSVVTKIAFVPSSVSQSVFPAFSELKSLSRNSSLEELYLRSTRYIVMLTIPFMILFIPFARKFLYFWLGPEFASEGTVPLQVLGSGYLMTFWAYSAVVGARGLDRPEVPAKFQALIAGINVLLCFVFIPWLGVKGAAFAWSFHRFLLIPLFIYFVGCRLFEISIGKLWNSSFKKAFLLGLITLALAFLIEPFLTSLFLVIFLFLLLSGLYLLLSYFFVFDISDREVTLEYVKKGIYFAEGFR